MRLSRDRDHGRHYAEAAMKLVDQWHDIENDLPEDWESVRLTLTTEQASTCRRSPGARPDQCRQGGLDAFSHSAGSGPQGAQTALRLFGRLDEERTWCLIEPPTSESPRARAAGVVEHAREEARSPRAGSGARAPALGLDRSPLRARDRLKHAARPHRPPLRTAQSGALRLAARLSVPLLGPVGVRRVEAAWRGAVLSGSITTGSRARTRVLRVLSDTEQRRHPGACVTSGRQDPVAPGQDSRDATAAERA